MLDENVRHMCVIHSHLLLSLRNISAAEITEGEERANILRKKEVDLIPMTVEDAVESLQFLGHDFFMFLDKRSGEINVVYKRDVAGYGVLAPRKPMQ